MTEIRAYALVGGIAVAFIGGLFLALRPASLLFVLPVLSAGLVLFLWGLLSTPPDAHE